MDRSINILLYHICLYLIVSYLSLLDCNIFISTWLYHIYLYLIVSNLSLLDGIIFISTWWYHIYLYLIVTYLSLLDCIIVISTWLYHIYLYLIVSYLSLLDCIIFISTWLYHIYLYLTNVIFLQVLRSPPLMKWSAGHVFLSLPVVVKTLSWVVTLNLCWRMLLCVILVTLTVSWTSPGSTTTVSKKNKLNLR